jgi:hypothetical protein
MSMADAKDLHADATRLLLDMHKLREQALAKSQENQTITVEIQGGSF